VEFEDPEILRAGVVAARDAGFLPSVVEMEVIGLCPQCQKEAL
jgi:Fe2+ or Zn2+ uptake regulation protein